MLSPHFKAKSVFYTQSVQFVVHVLYWLSKSTQLMPVPSIHVHVDYKNSLFCLARRARCERTRKKKWLCKIKFWLWSEVRNTSFNLHFKILQAQNLNCLVSFFSFFLLYSMRVKQSEKFFTETCMYNRVNINYSEIFKWWMNKLSPRDCEDLLFEREMYCAVPDKPCQTHMLAGDVEFLFASRNKRFKQNWN